MFLIKYFKMGFQFPKMIENSTKVNLLKAFIYFILLTFIANFPLTWLTFETQGSQINFIKQNMSASSPNWSTLPPGLISSGGISEDHLNGQSFVHNDFIYFFGTSDDIKTIEDMHIIVFHKDYIQYIDKNKNTINTQDYSGFETPILLSELNIATGSEREALYQLFASQIEKSFSPLIILYTVIRNQGIQLFATLIYILILSGIIQLFRFGFQSFLSYKEGLNFLILASTLPSVLALIFGLILPGFAPVVFNLVLGLVVMFTLLIFSRKKFS